MSNTYRPSPLQEAMRKRAIAAITSKGGDWRTELRVAVRMAPRRQRYSTTFRIVAEQWEAKK